MKRITQVSIIVLVLLLALFFVWFNSLQQMEYVEPYELNSSASARNLLIATQGSDYKNALVDQVLEKYKSTDTYIKVMDVSSLESVKPEEWQAIIIIQAWEKWLPQPAVEQFVSEHYDDTKMFIVTTSDSEDSQMEGIDGVTGASSLERVDSDGDILLKWLDGVFAKVN